MSCDLRLGDCLDVMRQLDDASVDSVVTDPPYGLEFMGKAWDAPWKKGKGTGEHNAGFSPGAPAVAGVRGEIKALPSFLGGTNPTCRTCGGTQYGKDRQSRRACSCEKGDFPDVRGPRLAALQEWHEAWATEALRVLKPGGHLVAFGGTRTYHRLAAGVEDAGFEIRDTLAWMYGSGFPKSLDVSKAIDKAAGAEREVTGTQRTNVGMQGGNFANGSRSAEIKRRDEPVTAAAAAAAAAAAGLGTALKPGHEPIICARKPLSVVPLDVGLLSQVHHALGGLICLMSSAKDADIPSTSNRVERHEATCASALASACLDSLRSGSGETGTFKSPAAASIASSIASSWSSILDALLDAGSRFTIGTGADPTTALRILNSCLSPITSASTIPRCDCLTAGESPHAPDAASSSSGEWENWNAILRRTVPEPATEQLASSVESVLANIANAFSFSDRGSLGASGSAPEDAVTALAPNLEPIVLARKPLAGTVAGNVLEHGTGALNIDGCRIGISGATRAVNHAKKEDGRLQRWDEGYRGARNQIEAVDAGRWPANVVLDEQAAAMVDAQAPDTGGGGFPGAKGGIGQGSVYGSPGSGEGLRDTGRIDENGGASRFYYCAKTSSDERHQGLATPSLFSPAGAPDANRHPTVKPIDLMRWLCRLITPAGGLILDPFLGSGTTGIAAALEGYAFIGIEREADYMRIAEARIAHWTNGENS